MALKVELIFRICSNIFPQTSRTQIFRAKMLSYILKYFILIKISCVTNIVNNYKNDFCMNEIPAFPTTKSKESLDDFPVPLFRSYRPGFARNIARNIRNLMQPYFFIRKTAPRSRATCLPSRGPRRPHSSSTKGQAVHHPQFMSSDTTGKLQEWRG